MARKPRKKQVEKNQVEGDVIEDEIEQELAEDNAEQEKEDAAKKREAALLDMKERLSDKLEELRESEKETAEEVRFKWIEVGRVLLEGKSLFTGPNSNQFNKAAFGDWITKNGFKELGARPTRAGAMWLAETFDTNPELYALIPSEGAEVRRSPRTIQAWVNGQINDAFQDAVEGEVSQPGKEAGKEDDRKAAVKNIFEFADEMIETAKSDEVKETWKLRRAVLSHHSAEDLGMRFAKFKPRQVRKNFKDRDVDDAAAYLFALLIKHEDASAILDAMREKLDEHVKKMEEEAKDEDEPGEDEDEIEVEEVSDDDDEAEIEVEDDDDDDE